MGKPVLHITRISVMGTHVSGTNYADLDTVKRRAAARAARTLEKAVNFHRMGWELLEWTRGESIMLWHHVPTGMVQGLMLEGLGTKNLIAECKDLRKRHRDSTFYEGIGWCNAAMSFNDAISLGALPIAFGVHPAVEDGSHLSGKNGDDLAEGTALACEYAGALYGPGETPGLPGIILPGTMCLSGAGIAQVPGGMKNVINPRNLKPGDTIWGCESYGVHANGISAIRKNIHKLPNRYCTEIPGGYTFGDALMHRTAIYVPFMRTCQELGVRFSYASHISGHGWAKILRAERDLRYVIEHVPEKTSLFHAIQNLLEKDDRAMYSGYNMGVGLVTYGPAEYDTRVRIAAEQEGLTIWKLGYVEEGPRSVFIKPLNIEYGPTDADIR